MSARPFRFALALALAAMAWPLGPSYAQDSDKRSQAESLNAEGKKRIQQLDLDGAAARFRAAMQLVDDPRYAFNLCYTLDKSGKFLEARVACQDVVASGDPRLGEKAAGLIEAIDAKLAEQAPTESTPIRPELEQTPPEPPVLPDKPMAPRVPRFSGTIGLSSANVDGSFNSDTIVGLVAGGTALVQSLPAFDLLAEAQYVQRGFSAEGAAGVLSFDVSMSYLDLGVSARYKIGHGQVQPYLQVGTALCIFLTGSADVDGMSADVNARAFDIATMLGGGLMIGALDVQARLRFGLLDINRDPADGIAMSASKHRVTSLEAGYWF